MNEEATREKKLKQILVNNKLKIKHCFSLFLIEKSVKIFVFCFRVKQLCDFVIKHARIHFITIQVNVIILTMLFRDYFGFPERLDDAGY